MESKIDWENLIKEVGFTFINTLISIDRFANSVMESNVK